MTYETNSTYDLSIVTPLTKLKKDVRKAAKILSSQEVRFLVDRYYQIQHERITAANQERASSVDGKPNELMTFFSNQQEILEKQIKSTLDTWSMSDPTTSWMRSIVGIGPVIACGFAAHFDITIANTQGKFLSYAGQLEGQKKKKGEKINWNPDLKRLCYLLGESFVKVSSNDKDFYGKLYKQRKEYEVQKNEAGDYGSQAQKAMLKNLGDDTIALSWYSKGMLPPAHIHMRCKKWAVKIFICHLHSVMHCLHYGCKPVVPYPFAHLNHIDYIPIPNFDFHSYPEYNEDMVQKKNKENM